MQAFKCLKRPQTLEAKKHTKNVSQSVRHLSDTCLFIKVKTAAYKCLTKCLTLSDSFNILTVCLAACPLDAPRQTPRHKQPFGVTK